MSPARKKSTPRTAPAPVSPPPSTRFDWRERLPHYWKLVRGDRPIGWLLLLWPTWWGLWLAADGLPPWHLLAIFSAGVWLMRSAGCVINDYADRWLDPHVERTRARPLAAGDVRPREALAVFVVLALVAFALVLLTNRLTVYMSVVGIALAASYPYLKRHTWFPQVYLGMAFGWAIPMAFTAVTGELPSTLGWLLFCVNVLWSTAYDTWYAMVDREDDIRMGAKSTAILFGELDRVAQGVLYAAFVFGLVLVGQRAGLGWPYWAALGVVLVQIGWQFRCAWSRSREGCFRAFLQNHWLGMVVFAGMAVALAIKPA